MVVGVVGVCWWVGVRVWVGRRIRRGRLVMGLFSEASRLVRSVVVGYRQGRRDRPRRDRARRSRLVLWACLS